MMVDTQGKYEVRDSKTNDIIPNVTKADIKKQELIVWKQRYIDEFANKGKTCSPYYPLALITDRLFYLVDLRKKKIRRLIG